MIGTNDIPATENQSRRSYTSAVTCESAPARESALVTFVNPEEPAVRTPDYAIDETEQILFALALAVEQRDCQTGGHCERLAFLAVALGTAMGLSRPELVALYRGGYLHDVGKVGIPDSILFKPGPLDADEWVTMRSHSTRGEDICKHMKSLAAVLPIIRHHHERWDGSGYPDGLRGEQIPLLARVLQIVDIYDALASPRSYKVAFTPERTLAMMQEETDRGWRDPRIVKVFMDLHSGFLSTLTHEALALDRTGDGVWVSLANLQRILAAGGLPVMSS